MSELIDRILRALRNLFRDDPESPVAADPRLDAAAGPTLTAHPPDSGVWKRVAANVRGPVMPEDEPVDEERTSAPRFLLSVDGAGQTLVVLGDRITIGHLRVGRADLPFLADVGPIHAELVRMESLRDGSVWSVRPREGETVRVNGQAVGEAGCVLSEGASIQLGENLAFRCLVPDDASRTVLLEVIGMAECAGAKTVALFGTGDGARLRIGASENRHVRVPVLEHEISIVAREEKLHVRCEAGVGRSGAAAAEVFTLPCPPPQRVDLQVGTSQGGRPPFSLALAPADLPEGKR